MVSQPCSVTIDTARRFRYLARRSSRRRWRPAAEATRVNIFESYRAASASFPLALNSRCGCPACSRQIDRPPLVLVTTAFLIPCDAISTGRTWMAFDADVVATQLVQPFAARLAPSRISTRTDDELCLPQRSTIAGRARDQSSQRKRVNKVAEERDAGDHRD